MTIMQAVAAVDDLLPNRFDTSTKIGWLSRLDSQAYREIFQPYGGEAAPFSGYDSRTREETALLLPEPFDECYVRYLQAQIHLESGEISRCNNAMALFQAVYDAFARHYHRTHMPREGVFQSRGERL